MPPAGATSAKTGARTGITCGRISAKRYPTNASVIVAKMPPNTSGMNASVAVVSSEQLAVSSSGLKRVLLALNNRVRKGTSEKTS